MDAGKDKNENDPSNGYEAIAGEFISQRGRSAVGAEIVRSWARTLPPGATILDLGCGNGIPITEVLVNEGFTLYGIDASPTMVGSYRTNFPGLPVACESVETSGFFGRTFDGVVAWGFIFLFPESAQSGIIQRVSKLLNRGGRFLFTSPEQARTWKDLLTGLESRSLGAENYSRVLSSAGFTITGNHIDEGENYYYFAKKE